MVAVGLDESDLRARQKGWKETNRVGRRSKVAPRGKVLEQEGRHPEEGKVQNVREYCHTRTPVVEVSQLGERVR